MKEYKMTALERIFTGLLVCLGFVLNSCSDDDFASKRERLVIPPEIKLSASATEITPFEKITLTLDIDVSFIRGDYEEGYDSISWITNGVAFSPIMLSVGKLPNSPCKLDITEYRPGIYKAYCLGYKDGEVASIDSVEYKVNPLEGDFIKINWTQPPYGNQYSFTTGVSPFNYLTYDSEWIGMGGEHLELAHYWGSEEYQFALLTLTYWSVWESLPGKSPQKAPYRRFGNLGLEYNFLHNYLCEFYGEPLLQYSGNNITQTDLWEEYEKRFTYPASFYPIEIWETPSSVICLSATDKEPENNEIRGFVKVIAQPRMDK